MKRAVCRYCVVVAGLLLGGVGLAAPWPLPADDAEYRYALDSGEDEAAALADAKAKLAEAVGVGLDGLTRPGELQGDAAAYRYAQALWQGRLLHGFEVVRGPQKDKSGKTWVLARCSRKSGFEAAVEKLAFDIHLTLKKGDRVVVCSPVNESGRYSALGNIVASTLSSALARYGSDSYAVFEAEASPGDGRPYKVVRGRLLADAGAKVIVVDLGLYSYPLAQKLWGKNERIVADTALLALSSVAGKEDPVEAGFQLGRAAPGGPGLSVELELSAGSFKKGDKVSIRFRAAEDGYAYMFNILDDGSVTMLLPNRFRQQATVEKDKWAEVPGALEKQAGVKFEVYPLEGRRISDERVKLIVTDRPIEEFGKIPMAGFESLAGTDSRLDELLETLQLLDKKKVRWGEARAAYHVSD